MSAFQLFVVTHFFQVPCASLPFCLAVGPYRHAFALTSSLVRPNSVIGIVIAAVLLTDRLATITEVLVTVEA